MYGPVFDALRSNPDLRLVKGDIRDPAAVNEALRGNNAVIHLACISNDPSFELDPTLGKSINYDCFRPLVRASKKAGIKRFIYASSSSVYGVKSEPEVTEELSCEPLTDYSKFKAMCEVDLAEEAARRRRQHPDQPRRQHRPHQGLRRLAAAAQSAHRRHGGCLPVPAAAG